MEAQPTATEVIWQEVDALVKKKEFRTAVVQCEELEILVGQEY